MKVKLGGKEYTIQFATRPSLKAHILQDIMNTQDMEDVSSMEDILLETLPKMLLVGLQVNHKDEFGYDYDTNEKYDEQFNKVLNLLSEKIDDGEIDCIELFNELENELESNSFLAKMMETEKKNRTPAKKTPSKTANKN